MADSPLFKNISSLRLSISEDGSSVPFSCPLPTWCLSTVPRLFSFVRDRGSGGPAWGRLEVKRFHTATVIVRGFFSRLPLRGGDKSRTACSRPPAFPLQRTAVDSSASCGGDNAVYLKILPTVPSVSFFHPPFSLFALWSRAYLGGFLLLSGIRRLYSNPSDAFIHLIDLITIINQAFLSYYIPPFSLYLAFPKHTTYIPIPLRPARHPGKRLTFDSISTYTAETQRL